MKKYLAIIILSVIACANAIYLTAGYYAIQGGSQAGSFCDINSKFSCTTVLQAQEALLFGIPFPAIAIVVYPVLAAIAAYGWYKKSFGPFRVLSVLSAGGIAFNSFFIYQETFVIKAFCPLCLLCTGIIIAIFVLSVMGRIQGAK